ncbi:MAG: flagellar export chaperone FliS [Bacillota bacterium]
MAIANPYEAYRRTQIQTASRGELLLMLYDGAIKFANQAKKAIEDGEVAHAHLRLIRVQDIVAELSATLDHDSSPDIADGLAKLYDYMMHLLVQANIKKDTEPLDQVISMLLELRETWRQVVREGGGATGRAEAVTVSSAANS